MPSSILDDVADRPFVSMMRFPSGLQTLKRGRTMEPRASPSPCIAKCCASLKEANLSSASPLACLSITKDASTYDDFTGFDASLPEDEFEDFDLGPPPPCGPVLVRQNAMDMTALAEAKLASFSNPSMARICRSTPMAPMMMPSPCPSSMVKTASVFGLPPMGRNT